ERKRHMSTAIAVIAWEPRSSSLSQINALELLMMATGSLLLLGTEVVISGPRIFRYFWLHELWTNFIASKPTIRQSLVPLRHSGDPTPPTYHSLARGFWWLLGGSSEIAFRTLTFISTWLALLLVYALLCQTFALLPALVAVLALWSSGTIIQYA